jgi:hypothetical protein
MEAKNKERYMYILGGVIVLGFFGAIALLNLYEMPLSSKDALLILLGALAGQFKDVGSYFFGSSKSSADKTDMMSKRDETKQGE